MHTHMDGHVTRVRRPGEGSRCDKRGTAPGCIHTPRAKCTEAAASDSSGHSHEMAGRYEIRSVCRSTHCTGCSSLSTCVAPMRSGPWAM